MTSIAPGCEAIHTLFIKSDGSLWGMGHNTYGQLGNGTFDSTNLPEEIVTNGISAVAIGYIHSLFLKNDHSLWAMGNNNWGQLGDGAFFNGTNEPEKIVGGGVTAITAGGYHSLFLKSDGSLWVMGRNSTGQLGDGTFNDTNQPEQIVASDVTTIAAGSIHTLFLKSDGSLWAMGDNDYGQLGDGRSGANVFVNKPKMIVASGVTAIAAGFDHSLFLKSDGGLWAMGSNFRGQLGDGTFINFTNRPEKIVANGVTTMAAGDVHSLFNKSDGSLWAMGDGEFSQLGDGFVDTNAPFGTADPEQIYPSPQPFLSQTISSNTNLQFTATCGFGGSFYLLAGTNLSQPLSQWTPVWTNVITARNANLFTAMLTNTLNSGPQQFYILQSK